jgi:hypothetical protein
LSDNRNRLRNGGIPPSGPELTNLALIFGLPEAERTLSGRWDAIAPDSLVDDALTYVELESEATSVRSFKIDLVDGLLQTPEYAACVARANLPLACAETVAHQVDVALRRQERLAGDHPLQVDCVLAEGALRTQVGGRAVMRAQLERLLALAELPNVSLRVVPADGAYPAMGTPFYLLSFSGGQPDIGYIELVDKGVYLDEADEVEPYTRRFTRLQEVALDRVESARLIGEVAAADCRCRVTV